ncbi:unnamed protein product [Mesocestoides corti]|uniref:Uncharacterized protein n=1 Tax=Mesocestoides corti TaxID=53468 RepID=A0A0R3U1X8_MESCO|nr:unnamed protein product [Mesocestoides corti]
MRFYLRCSSVSVRRISNLEVYWIGAKKLAWKLIEPRSLGVMFTPPLSMAVRNSDTKTTVQRRPIRSATSIAQKFAPPNQRLQFSWHQSQLRSAVVGVHFPCYTDWRHSALWVIPVGDNFHILDAESLGHINN